MTYAILQKSTGKFLPQFKGGYGASSVDPTYQDIMPPRLFRTEKVASRDPDDMVVVQVSIVWSTQL